MDSFNMHVKERKRNELSFQLNFSYILRKILIRPKIGSMGRILGPE